MEITKTEDGVIQTETQEVIVQQFTFEELTNELNSVKSELEKFDQIMLNRKAYLQARLIDLQAFQAVAQGHN